MYFFYLFNCITKLKYYFNRTILKYRLLTRYLNHYKKFFYIFWFSYIKEKNVKFNNKGKKSKFNKLSNSLNIKLIKGDKKDIRYMVDYVNKEKKP